MATLASLKLVAAKKPANQPPVVQRRNKLCTAIFHQIQLAKAQAEGGAYAPTRMKTVTNSEGQRVSINAPKRIKPWWFTSATGTCCIAIHYGSKVLEIAKGKSSIEVAGPAAIAETLETVKAAVLAGELDAQIEMASGQLSSGFKK